MFYKEHSIKVTSEGFQLNGPTNSLSIKSDVPNLIQNQPFAFIASRGKVEYSSGSSLAIEFGGEKTIGGWETGGPSSSVEISMPKGDSSIFGDKPIQTFTSGQLPQGSSFSFGPIKIELADK